MHRSLAFGLDILLSTDLVCAFRVLQNDDSQIRAVEINESEAEPLVGMGLLEGYELNIQGLAGGTVTIKALS